MERSCLIFPNRQNGESSGRDFSVGYAFTETRPSGSTLSFAGAELTRPLRGNVTSWQYYAFNLSVLILCQSEGPSRSRWQRHDRMSQKRVAAISNRRAWQP